jgi:hypothetical protein
MKQFDLEELLALPLTHQQQYPNVPKKKRIKKAQINLLIKEETIKDACMLALEIQDLQTLNRMANPAYFKADFRSGSVFFGGANYYHGFFNNFIKQRCVYCLILGLS